MSDIKIDGKPVGNLTKFTLDFESYDPTTHKPSIALGRQDVTGTMVVHFEDAEALAEYCRRDVELTSTLMVAMPLLERKLRWRRRILTAMKIIVVVGLILFATGAAQ